jgi:ribonuclease Z
LELLVLGSNSASPAFNRHPTAQVLKLAHASFLIDCGEGTQFQLLRYRVKLNRITHIFISHLHGDHYLGLTGLLFTMHLNGRTRDLHLFAQPELMDILELQLRLSGTVLRFNLIFHPIRHFGSQVIYEDEWIRVKTLIMNHCIPCTGFLFIEQSSRPRLNTEMLEKYQVPVTYYSRIRDGNDFVMATGEIIPATVFHLPPRPPAIYAFCSDTLYSESLLPEISHASLLYHEATFMDELLHRAESTYHSTARQAAMLASRASVKKLLIGHFSSRYRDLEPLLQEARSVFPRTELAVEGMKYMIE